MSLNPFVIQNCDFSKKSFEGRIVSEVVGFYDGLALVNVDVSLSELQKSVPIADQNQVVKVLNKNVLQKDLLCFCDNVKNVPLDPTILSKIKQLHFGVSLNTRRMEEEVSRLKDIWSTLQNHFVCVHIRMNNNQGYTSFKGHRWPEAFEVTWIRKNLVDSSEDYVGCFPTELDVPMNPKKPSFTLRGYPFCGSRA